MSEHLMETRGRSRSKTPFLRSNCDHEHCEHAGEEGHQHHHHPKKKAAAAPNVHTIIEETPSDKTKYKTTTTTTTTSTTTSNKAKTGSPENKIRQSNQSSRVTSETTTIITKSSKQISGGASGPTSSTPKTSHMLQSFAAQYSTTGSGGDGGGGSVGRRVKEVTQNELNTRFERSQLEQKANKSTSSWKQNSSNVQNGDMSDHIAYKEYKLAGEYWNKTPKTDYTYSELSPHRRELAPGVIAMPNMSRRGLENHNDRVYHMIERNPAQEEFIRKRYFAQDQQNYVENRRATERLLYDSGDELDYTQFERHGATQQTQLYKNRYSQQEEASWFWRLITTVVTFTTSVWTSISGGDIDDYHRVSYGQNYAEQRGFFGTIGHSFLSFLRYIYLAISSVLYLDTWLLQSSNANNRGKKRFLLLLLILLPLLLLAGTYYYLHPNEPFPPKSLTEIAKNLPQIPQLPELPKIDLSEYVNQEKYEAFKNEAAVHLENLRDWTDDYFLYLKTLSQNLVDKSRQMFQNEEHFERV